jgi:hypothetical protein
LENRSQNQRVLSDMSRTTSEKAGIFLLIPT